MSPNQVELDCTFITGRYGRLFITWTRPIRDADIIGSVLFFPPFADEMNKCRRMVALQARALARDGFAVLIVDLPGCGDSYGDFVDVSWSQWLDELCACMQWMRKRLSVPLYLWACRMGALLAVEFTAMRAVDVAGLLLWQPIADGRSIVSGFLRLALAAELTQSRGDRPSVGGLREQLANGDVVEIAGYELNGGLAGSIESVSLADFKHPCADVYWLEVSRRSESRILPASTRVIEHWQENGVAVHAEVIQGDAFWNTVEIMEVPALAERSRTLLLSHAK